MKAKLYRQSRDFLRNEYTPCGEWGFPLLYKQPIDLNSIALISYSDTGLKKQNIENYQKGIHFFVDDYRFESLYRNPRNSIEKLKKYRFVLTPDYSLYSEMPLWRQIESVGKNRWVGAYWQANGLGVIPTVSWAQPSSFRFCFDGIEHRSVVAVGMIGCKRNRVAFLRGYDAMLSHIEPEAVICFGQPFPEMEGRILKVDYMASRKVV